MFINGLKFWMLMAQNNNPAHIAVIMDGNRRYAKKLGLQPWLGHKYGAEKIKQLIDWCSELNIKELTLYTFSLDNFNRPQQEKDELFKLFKGYKEYFKGLKKRKGLHEKKIRVRFIGRINRFPKKVQKVMEGLMEETKNNDGLNLNFAMAYSGKAEIVDAFKKIVEKLKKHGIDEASIDENLINENVYLSSAPDILIRPGGEKRISDFLLWQVSYAELFFLDKLWPEFEKKDLIKIIEEFKARERRFGR